MSRRFNCDEGTLSQIRFRLPQCIHNMPEQRFGQDVFRPQLHDARSMLFGRGKDRAEVEIVRKENVAVGGTPSKHYFIGCVCRADLLPVR